MTAFFLSLLVGASSWTFAEYFIHRWFGHAKPGTMTVTDNHLAHHRTEGWFAEPLPKALLVAKVVGLVALVGAATGALVGAAVPTGLGLALGFGGGFCVYEYVHWRLHAHGPTNAWGASLRLHHFAHHNGKPKANFGVTSFVWDRVLGTFEPVEAVRLSARRAPVWLLDPQTKAVRAPFAGQYHLLGRAR